MQIDGLLGAGLGRKSSLPHRIVLVGLGVIVDGV